MNGTFQYLCTVQSCVQCAAKTYILRFHSPEIAEVAQPGQFVNILTAEYNKGPLLRRPFSISRIDGQSIDILFHVVGTGTNLLSQKRPGEQIDVMGPLGQPYHHGGHGSALLVAGGIGVAPFPFLTDELIKQGTKIETFLGFRTSDQIYTDHLSHVHIATDDGSTGFHGYVVQLLESFLDQNNRPDAKIYACGPTVMLKALAHLAGRKALCCEMSLEGQMACGVGICQGCAVERSETPAKYALVCKDGPTFLSTEVNLP